MGVLGRVPGKTSNMFSPIHIEGNSQAGCYQWPPGGAVLIHTQTSFMLKHDCVAYQIKFYTIIYIIGLCLDINA